MEKTAVEEIAVIANLPNLEIKVAHRDVPGEGAEVVVIQIKAFPSFEAFGRGVQPGMAMMMPWMAPFQLWSAMAERTCQAWLAAAGLPWVGVASR